MFHDFSINSKEKYNDCNIYYKVAIERFLIIRETTTFQVHSKFSSVNVKITGNQLRKHSFVSLSIARLPSDLSINK